MGAGERPESAAAGGGLGRDSVECVCWALPCLACRRVRCLDSPRVCFLVLRAARERSRGRSIRRRCHRSLFGSEVGPLNTLLCAVGCSRASCPSPAPVKPTTSCSREPEAGRLPRRVWHRRRKALPVPLTAATAYRGSSDEDCGQRLRRRMPTHEVVVASGASLDRARSSCSFAFLPVAAQRCPALSSRDAVPRKFRNRLRTARLALTSTPSHFSEGRAPLSRNRLRSPA